MKIRLAEIVSITQGEVDKNTDLSIVLTHVSTLEEAGEGGLSFLHLAKYQDAFYQTKATAVLVDKQFVADKQCNCILIRVDDVYATLTHLLEFIAKENQKTGIEEPVFIGRNVDLPEGIYLGAFAYVGHNVKLGKHVKIYPNCYIGDDVCIGDHSIIYAGVKIYHQCEIGKNCIIHSGAVIGSDGFGHLPQKDGSYKKIPQLGKVLIHDHVEIGANTTIDRATMEATIIHSGVKLDNQIQVAHNVEIGENTVLAAQTGVSGSTRLGKRVLAGGQVGFAGHLEIADGSQFGAKSGIASSIREENKQWFGVPLMPVKDTLRLYAILKKMPELYRKINAQEKKLEELNKHLRK
jgi:UDP-3-O-[3-hydroxymyristoyl] glucosamine N-acyltransferase